MEFSSDLFFDEVRALFQQEIFRSQKEFYNEILNISKQRNIDINEKDLDKRCHQVFKLLSKHGKVNLEKFQIYLFRNILINSQNNLIISNDTTNEELNKKKESLTELRKQYLELVQENHQMNQECLAKEQLLDQMNSTFFQYRVGLQVLDSCEVNPLDNSIAQLQQQASHLKSLTNKSEELIQEIQQSIEITSTELLSTISRSKDEVVAPNFPDIQNSSPIQTVDSDDIRLLNSAFS